MNEEGGGSRPIEPKNTRPVPDPTSLTTEALHHEIAALKELLETKMTGHFLIDNERFGNIEERFGQQERLRVEQKTDLSAAVGKSEAATEAAINKLGELSKTTSNALSEKIDDLKERVGGIEAMKLGAVESRTEGRAAISSTTALIGAFIAVIVLALALYAGLRTPSAPSPQIVTVPTETTTP